MCLLRSDWVIAQLVRQNRLENRTSCNSFLPDFHVSGTRRVRDIRATCHTLRLTHVQGNRQAPCGRIASCSGALSESEREGERGRDKMRRVRDII